MVVTAIGSTLGLAGGVLGEQAAGLQSAALDSSRQRDRDRRKRSAVLLLALSVITAVIFGVLPALRMSRGMPIASLREGGRGTRGGIARRGLRQALVVSEVALAVVLVVGASLLVKSFWKMQRVDPGFVPDRMVVVQIQLPPSRYAELRTAIACVRSTPSCTRA